MSLWAQIGNTEVQTIPADSTQYVDIYAEFSFASKTVPAGTPIYFRVGKGQVKTSLSSDTTEGVSVTVLKVTEDDITKDIAALTDIGFIQKDGTKQPTGTSNAGPVNILYEGSYQTRVAAKITLGPIPTGFQDEITIVAWCKYDEKGTANRLTLQSQTFGTDVLGSKAGGLYLADVQKYDTLTDTWTILADAPFGASGAFSCTINGGTDDGKILVAGGFNGSFSAAVAQYDPSTDGWILRRQTMPSGKAYGMTVSYNGKVYAIGGYHLNPANAAMQQCYAYDSSVDDASLTPSWTEIAAMPFPVAFGRAEVMETVDGACIYVLGGAVEVTIDNQIENIRRFNYGVLKYNITNDKWTIEDPVITTTTIALIADSAIGATSIKVTSQTDLPPYGIITVNRAGLTAETLSYSSYNKSSGLMILDAATENTHYTAESVILCSLSENRIYPASFATVPAPNTGTISVFYGRSYLGYNQDATTLLPTSILTYDIVSKIITSGALTSTECSAPCLPRYRAGCTTIGSKTYVLGGSSSKTSWQNKIEVLDTTTNIFDGPTGYTKMPLMKHSMAIASDTQYIYVFGGSGSGHASNWLKITMAADKDSIRADGKETASIVLTATDASGDAPAPGTEFKLTGYLYVSDSQLAETVAKNAAVANAQAIQAATPIEATIPKRISIIPVLLSSNKVAMTNGTASALILERSEDPITAIQSLLDFTVKGETVTAEAGLKTSSEVITPTVILLGQQRTLYSIAVEATCIDPNYVGQSDTDAAVTGQAQTQDAPLGDFTFNPPRIEQGQSATIRYYSDIASIPDVQLVSSGVSAASANTKLDTIKEEIPFGASPLIDATMLGIRTILDGSQRSNTNLILTASDNDGNSSIWTPSDVVDAANSINGAGKSPVFNTSFVITYPVSLAARRARTDVSDLEYISNETGGQSFSIVNSSYIDFVIDRIKTSAPASIGNGTVTKTWNLEGALSSVACFVSNVEGMYGAPVGNTATIQVSTSTDGYEYTDFPVIIPANMVYAFYPPITTNYVRYKVTLQSLSFDSPVLTSVLLDYVRPTVSYLFTYPQTISGQLTELAAVVNHRLPNGAKVEVGTCHGDSLMFEQDFKSPTQPTIAEEGVIVSLNRSSGSDVVLDDVGTTTSDILTTTDNRVFKSKTGAWPEDATATVYLNQVAAGITDYFLSPRDGVVVFKKTLLPTDVVSLTVDNRALFRVGLKITNPTMETGFLDSFAYSWGTTEDANGVKYNRPPRAINAYISTPVSAGGPLVANYTYTDSDNNVEDTTKTEIIWYRNGAPVSEIKNKRTVKNSDLIIKKASNPRESLISKGQEWMFSVRPSDGESFGPITLSKKITISNIPPLVKNVVLQSSNINSAVFTTSDDIVVSYQYIDTDNDLSKGTVFKWYANNVLVKEGTSSQLLATDVFNNQKILAPDTTVYCEITPSDGTDFGATVRSPVVDIVSTPPVVSSVFILPLSPMITSTMQAKYTFTDADDLPDQSRIAWFKDGIRISALDDLQNISAIQAGLQPDQRWYVVITPFNGKSEGTPVVSATVIVLL